MRVEENKSKKCLTSAGRWKKLFFDNKNNDFHAETNGKICEDGEHVGQYRMHVKRSETFKNFIIL